MTRKDKVQRIVVEKGLCSCMNDTKWRELKQGVKALPFHPPLVIKDVDEEEAPYHDFGEDVFHCGDWGIYSEHYLGGDIYATPFYAVEWIKVRPRYKKRHRKLISDEIIDETDAFLSVLEKHNIPFEEHGGAFIIYGYRA